MAVDLWPKWRLTKGLVELIEKEWSGLDKEHLAKSMEKHRLERAMIPDLTGIIDGARTLAKLERINLVPESQSVPVKLSEERQSDLRAMLDEMDDAYRKWVWRYARDYARYNLINRIDELVDWPNHWEDPEPKDWPIEVLYAYSICLMRVFGNGKRSERIRRS